MSAVKTEFKVGDKVRCLVSDRSWKKGDEFIINEVDTHSPPLAWAKGVDNGMYFTELELIKPKMKLKVGDKVKLKDYNRFPDYKRHDGEIGIITSTDNDTELSIHIEWKDGDGSSVDLSNVELVTDKVKTKKLIMNKPLAILRKGEAFINRDTYEVIDKCVDMNEPVLLIGETGVGKTTVVRELAKDKSKNLVRISLNGSTGVEEILGKWLANKGTTIWQDGILTDAIRNGHWVVMDEINAALPEILFTLHSLLDDDRHIILAEKDNEKIKPHKDFRFFATMNPPEEYAGTKDLNKALVSRFTAVINIHPLNDVEENRLLQEMYAVKPEPSFQLVDMANKLRKAKHEEKIMYFCSTRDLVQVGKLLNSGLDMSLAVAAAVMNKMSKEELKEVMPIFNGMYEVQAPTMTYAEMITYIGKLEKKHSKLEKDHEILEQVTEKLKDEVLKKMGVSIEKTVKASVVKGTKAAKVVKGETF